MNTLFTKSASALALLGLVLGGCQPDLDAPKADAGQLDFTSYVAVGNSLTAGYQSGGLFNAGQLTSYPALLAMQFQKTGKGPASFITPTFADNEKDGSGYLNFQGFVPGSNPPAPILLPAGAAGNTRTYQLARTGTTLLSGEAELRAYTGPQPDNLGVPGISVLSSVSSLTGGLAPYGALNPFFQRLLPANERLSTDYVTYISRKTPTFFTCWMGNNDVLAYATAGGVVSPTNPFGGLTDTTRFGIGYRAILGAISKNGTVKGVAANIPNVTNVPYFTTVRVAPIKASLKAANSAFSLYINTASGVREATDNDLLTLTSSAVVGRVTAPNPIPLGATPTNPLPSQYVLDATELAAVQTRTTELNTIIARTARKNKVPLADMNAFFATIAGSSISLNATANSTSFLVGNLFSLDGIHPTSRGYAVVANEFIRVINANYGSTIQPIDPNAYNAVLFP